MILNYFLIFLVVGLVMNITITVFLLFYFFRKDN